MIQEPSGKFLFCSLQSRARPTNRQGFYLDSELSRKAATFSRTVILHQDFPHSHKNSRFPVGFCSTPSPPSFGEQYLDHAVPSSYSGSPPHASSGGHLTEQLGQFALHLGWKHFILELLFHHTQKDCVQQEAQNTQSKLAQTGTAIARVRMCKDPYKRTTKH